MLTLDGLEELVCRSTGTRRQDIGPQTRLVADLGLDSMGLLELCSALLGLGVRVSERDWLAAQTVGDLYQHLQLGTANAEKGLDVDSRTTRDLGASPVEPSQPKNDEWVAPPQVSGVFFRLSPVLPQHTPFLYHLNISPDVGFRWRYRGGVPSYDKFEADLWNGLLAQFVIESIESGEPVGQVICYNPDFGLGHAYVGAALIGRYRASGIAVEPVRLFVQYIFDVWPFHKLYFEIPEFNFQQFSSVAGGALKIEGRLVNHEYYKGRRWDRLILAAYRDAPSDVPPKIGSVPAGA